MISTRRPDVDQELAPGERVGPYTVTSLLGEGGMGFVYQASVPDGDPVALKLIKSSLADDEMFIRRFEREAKAAASVQHSHVVSVLDLGIDGDKRWMALELVRGGSLEDRLAREGSLPLEEAVRVGLEVSSALDALHGVGLVHRDVKPANILMGEDGRTQLTDFGLAKQRDASVLTQAGQTVGSMDYMAPEQIRGETEVTGAADVYSLGCVLYECITGATPFADKEGMRILWAHLQEEPPDPCAKRQDAPSSLGWAITQALRKEPSHRPPTATAYARMVQAGVGSTGGGT